jgi:cystathionine gamma-synthase
MSATYLRDADNGYSAGYVYGRTDNVSVEQAQNVIAALEGADEALLFGSGMAAATTVLLALEKPTHIVASQVMYWGFRSWLREIGRYGHSVTFVETSDLNAVRAAVRPGETGLFWIETPSNPLWSVTDIAAIADIAHACGALLCVDSTVATPVLTRPLSLGAEVFERSFGRRCRRTCDFKPGRALGAYPKNARSARQCAWTVRSLAADARDANARCSRQGAG